MRLHHCVVALAVLMHGLSAQVRTHVSGQVLILGWTVCLTFFCLTQLRNVTAPMLFNPVHAQALGKNSTMSGKDQLKAALEVRGRKALARCTPSCCCDRSKKKQKRAETFCLFWGKNIFVAKCYAYIWTSVKLGGSWDPNHGFMLLFLWTWQEKPLRLPSSNPRSRKAHTHSTCQELDKRVEAKMDAFVDKKVSGPGFVFWGKLMKACLIVDMHACARKSAT